MKLPLKLFQFALTAVTMCAVQVAAAVSVPPLPLPGPYAVECSDVAQDTTKLPAGEDIQLYWEGVPRSDGSVRKPTDLLLEPASTPLVTVQAPATSAVYGSFAGRALPYVVIVCHPTTASNPRGDYSLPTGKIVPHMMRSGDAPIWPDATTRFPVLVFSHGYGGSPISNDYIYALTVFASFGYVVAAPFHTDATFSDLQLDNVSDVIYLLTHLQNFLAMQALRPLALSASIDLLEADPQWRDRIDSAQIGGFGASMGGESMMLMAGAGLTTSVGLSWTQIEHDTRLKAAVGYVPYFGQPILPSFGRDQHGLDGVTLPFLGMGGTADTTAPIAVTAQGMLQLDGPRELVALTGVKHEFSVPATNDIFTWSVTWLDAMVRGNESAKSQLSQMTSVAGGVDDFVVIPLNAMPGSNFTGLWWAAGGTEPGWGINFEQQGDQLYATWYTYDTNGRPLWLSMLANRNTPSGNVYTGPIVITRGPPFNNYAGAVTSTVAGTGTLTFTDRNSGSFAYSVNGVSQTKALARFDLGTGPQVACTYSATTPDFAAATNYQDLWWVPNGAESGWGITLAHQGDAIFATWYTYDVDNMPLWLTVLARRVGTTGTYTGTLYRTSGPRFDAYDASKIATTAVGSATLTFANGNNATLAYATNGAGGLPAVSQSKTITRFPFAPSGGTLCQ